MAKNDRICTVQECGNPAMTRGWCRSHYLRWYKHGSPTAGRIPQGAAQAFFRSTVLGHNDAATCLIWPYGRDSDGYGRLWTPEGAENVCRLVCESAHGPSPEGWHAAHSCGFGHEGCVNPMHLRWATPLQNASDRVKHKTLKIGRHASK